LNKEDTGRVTKVENIERQFTTIIES